MWGGWSLHGLWHGSRPGGCGNRTPIAGPLSPPSPCAGGVGDGPLSVRGIPAGRLGVSGPECHGQELQEKGPAGSLFSELREPRRVSPGGVEGGGGEGGG